MIFDNDNGEPSKNEFDERIYDEHKKETKKKTKKETKKETKKRRPNVRIYDEHKKETNKRRPNVLKKVIVEESDRKNKDESNIAVVADEGLDVSHIKLKGSKLDDKKHTVCLDCGKVFVQRSSYVLHARL